MAMAPDPTLRGIAWLQLMQDVTTHNLTAFKAVAYQPPFPQINSMEGGDEAQLKEVMGQYQEQLSSLADSLTEDPNNNELLELQQHLQEAFELSLELLKEFEQSAAPVAAERAAEQPQLEPASRNEAGPAGPGPGSQQLQTPSVTASRARGRNNARMHPSNQYYKQEPDFLDLAQRHPQLAQYITKGSDGRAHFDYTSWEGTHTLTAVLLKADFGVQWELPDGALVPTLTNRANYIHWVSDLLALSAPPGSIRGLDIGCGSNFIYCLLGVSIYDWSMVGADVTDVALEWARRQVQQNPHMAHLLEVRDSRQEEKEGEQKGTGGILLPALRGEDETFAFSMCNPPFFESMREANANPNTACGGTAAEMVYPGGEVAFIMRMVEDSMQLRGRIHWVTSMVGKKSSLKVLKKELHARNVAVLRTTELLQGKTVRWALAWSFSASRQLNLQPLPRPTPATPGADAVAAAHAVCAAPMHAAPRTVVATRSTSFEVNGGADGRKLLSLLAQLLTAQGAACTVDLADWSITAQLSGMEIGQALSSYAVATGGAPDSKRQKLQEGGRALQQSGLSAQIRVFQRQRGKFDVTAKIPNVAGLPEATIFAGVVAQLRAAVALQWH